MLVPVLVFLAANGESADALPYVGGVAGLLSIAAIVFYAVRFQFKYIAPLEKRLEACEEERERDEWRNTFLVSIMRSNGIAIPARWYADDWRKAGPPYPLPSDDVTL